jgi:hypothetical protein
MFGPQAAYFAELFPPQRRFARLGVVGIIAMGGDPRPSTPLP